MEEERLIYKALCLKGEIEKLLIDFKNEIYRLTNKNINFTILDENTCYNINKKELVFDIRIEQINNK